MFIHSIYCLVTSPAHYSTPEQDNEFRAHSGSRSRHTSGISEDDGTRVPFTCILLKLLSPPSLCLLFFYSAMTWFLLLIKSLYQVPIYDTRLQSIYRSFNYIGIDPEEYIPFHTTLPMMLFFSDFKNT